MSKKILTIHSEENIRESLKLILEDSYELIFVEDIDAGFEVLKNSTSIGLILLELKMPKTSGLNSLKTIKKKYPKHKIIIVVGYNSQEITTEAKALGAAGVILKPLKSEDILETVRKYLKESTKRTKPSLL